VIGVVLVLTAVGGLVARSIYQPAANASTPPAAAPPPTSAPTSGPPIKQPGSPKVQLSADAAASPYGATIQNLLQVYFNSINDHNYQEWESVATPALIQENLQGKWQTGYKTTQDGSMYVYRINSSSGGQLRVLITFTSTQALANAPDFAKFTCVNWSQVMPIVNMKGSWRIDVNPSGAPNPGAAQCPSS
jgi:hypothetical protein